MNDQWKRLDGWFKSNLPDVVGELRPGCTEEALIDFETTLGRSLPDELKAFYRIHDGQPDDPVTGLFYGMPFLSLANAAKHWQMWEGIRDGETAVGMAQLSTFCSPRNPV